MTIFRNLFARREEPEEIPPPEPAEDSKPRMLAKLRKAPPDDAQPDFFVPVLCDLPLKDDVNLMDVAPYRLSVHTTDTQLKYRLNDAEITITSPREYGLPTVKDYDIIIHMISYLNAEAEKWRNGHIDKPPRHYRPNAYDILKFCRRGDGGKQNKILEDALDRLSHMTLKITSDDGVRREATGGIHLVEGWKAVSRSKTGKVQDVMIGIPGWIYDGVVREAPSILTLHPDYFLLDVPLDRSLYRLARKTAGRDKSSYMMPDVHQRSGSIREFKKFAYDMRQLIGEGRRILDYDFTITKTGNGERLDMRYAGKPRQSNVKALVPPLKTTTYDTARKYANGLDIYAAESVWRAWIAEKEFPVPTNPDAAFLGWFKKYAANRR